MRLAVRVFFVLLFGVVYWLTVHGGPGIVGRVPFEVAVDDVVGAVFWLAAAWLAVELLRMFVRYQARRQGIESRLPRLLFDIGGIVIFFCAGLVIVSKVFGLELSGLLVTSGIIAAAAGFALQPTATDLIAGISLNFREGMMKLGDWVQLANGTIGRVTQITWSDTHLTTLDDRMVVIRNSRLVEQALVNFNAPSRAYQAKLKIVVGFDAPPERVAAILQTAMAAVPNMIAEPKPYVILEELGDSGVGYGMYYYVPDYPEAQFITSQVGMNALKFLDQAGFAPAYPKREQYESKARREEQRIERRIDIGGILKRVPLFHSFGAEEIDTLARTISLQELKPGIEVVREGEAGASLFIVVAGLLDVFKRTDKGEARKVGLLTPGNVFGEWSLLTGAPRSASITVATEASLIEIDKTRLEPILSGHPEIVAELSRIEAERTSANISAMAFTPAERKEIEEVGMAAFLRQKIMRFFSGGGA
jgi:small-conductance mechanosensitive channel/CRP-like cAMP-binding protein